MLKKRIKKLRRQVPDKVAETAAQLNPLTPPVPEEPVKLEDVPQITNETIAEHREEVLKGARKYIYPLQHSKHRIVVVTATIVVAAIIGFLVYCATALYKLHQYNTFIYRVTQVAPFPVARTGGTFVAYENYLFELRHYVHFYQQQLGRDFNGDNKQQLVQYRTQALQNVINNAYVKILASKNHVSVSSKEVDSRITEVRDQNRLGSNNKVFADVLRDYWGWSVSDFKRSLKQQILAEKVVAKLDTADTKKAADALAQVKSGTDFATIAKQASDDPAAATTGGDYGFPITKSNPNVPPQIVDALFKLKPGQTSNIINAGSSLQIVKLLQINGDQRTALHIVFNLKDISTYLDPLKAKQPAHTFIKL